MKVTSPSETLKLEFSQKGMSVYHLQRLVETETSRHAEVTIIGEEIGPQTPCYSWNHISVVTV